jgi:perosamine synthetase
MILHNKPTLGIEEQIAASRVIASGWLAQGREVEQFENEMCGFLGLPDGHAVAVSSGTAALFLSLWASDAKDKNVGFPTYVCSAVRNAVAMAGANEIIFDVAKNTPNIDVDALNKLNPDIAIIPHMFGIPADITKIKNRIVIEDCAQSLGAKVNGTNVGLIGNLGVFSFYVTKLITSGGQGGMIVSKDKAITECIKDFREFDCKKDNKKRFNFQMTDLQAAIGRVQLRKLPQFLEKRNEIFDIYKQKGFILLDNTEKNILPVRYRAVLKTKKQKQILKVLIRNGIKAIVPIEDWELLGEKNDFKNAMEMARSTVSLPIYPSLKKKEIEFTIEELNKLVDIY